MSELAAVLAANDVYVDSFPHSDLMPGKPTRELAVLTCMDCRLEPDVAMGIRVPEANFIRNAGGRVTEDAIRSLVVATQFLGASEILVVHHTDCGMAAKTPAGIVSALGAKSSAPGAAERAAEIDWMTIGDQKEALLADVAAIRRDPLISEEVPVHGLLLDPKTGRLTLVEEHRG